MKYLSLKEIQQVELNLLLRITRFCDGNNLIYTLAGGTLLGAIRHKGFIPWDDDVDILLPRPDYEKLLRLLEKQSQINYCIYKDANSIYPYLKILNKKVKIKHGRWSKKYSFDNSDYLWVDVFPLDGVPESNKDTYKFFAKIRFVKKCYSCSILNYRHGISFPKLVIERMAFPLFRYIGPLKLAGYLDKISQSYNYNISRKVAGIVWGYGLNEVVNKEKYSERVKVDFEGHKMWAPGCWDEYLTNLYGNYMKLPPIEQRSNHHVIAYWI